MTSAARSTLARCRHCGKEFDGRKFQVVLSGRSGAYCSADCALLTIGGARPRARLRIARSGQAVTEE
jgi:hypothetical protein